MQCSYAGWRQSVAAFVGFALVAALLAFAGGSQTASPGTAFTYQGRLKLGGNPVNGSADVRFTLFDAPTSPATQIGATAQFNNLTLVDGFIALNLDFGQGAFDGNARWLEIEIRSPAGIGSFITLSPRQSINPVPYALYALNTPGTPGNFGQSATTTYGTAALGISQTTTAYTPIPGLTQTIDLPENASLYISADGGVQTTVSASESGFSRVDIAFFIDGQMVNNAGFRRVTAANTGGISAGMIANWHMALSPSLAPGQHTIEVRARYNAGAAAFVSGNAGNPLQAQLTAMVLKH